MVRPRGVLVGVLVALALAGSACGGTSSSSSPPAGVAAEQAGVPSCEGAIYWEEASSHVGERATVQGPVVSTHFASTSNGQPTFLNVGRDYPDPGRFTIVIWGEDRASFPAPPEDLYNAATICVTGTIDTYEGVPQIVANAPSDILTAH